MSFTQKEAGDGDDQRKRKAEGEEQHQTRRTYDIPYICTRMHAHFATQLESERKKCQELKNEFEKTTQELERRYKKLLNTITKTYESKLSAQVDVIKTHEACIAIVSQHIKTDDAQKKECTPTPNDAQNKDCASNMTPPPSPEPI